MRIVTLLSGGLDSSTLLYELRAEGHQVQALAIHYGQRHAREVSSAYDIAHRACIPFEVIDLHTLGDLLQGSSLTDHAVPVPEGHYEDESMKQTVVPNRNMLLLAAAGAVAIARQADAVAYAAHAGDHAIYPDCRPAFVDAMATAFALADWRPLQLLRPFIGITKAAIVARGAELGVPFDATWSCYKGGRLHCGRCGTCVERREAFALAGVADPTAYEKE
jgi:7-cyano-7-deazaguanine synthase